MEAPTQDQDFKPREYQVEMLEIAMKCNTIVFMPTGSGKTFIAAMLIKQLAKDVEKKYSEGGKRTFFLVNTVALVSQQADSISRTLPLSISTYSGDMGVDYWDSTKWLSELEGNQVLVMTAQIFLNLLMHNYVEFSRVNLLIMDECHHAMHNHAMNQIMDLYRKKYCDNNDGNQEDRPRILGLTATLLNANCKIDKIETEIKTLEYNLNSKVITASDEEMVKKYSTNPKEEVRYYREVNINPVGCDLLDTCLKYLYKVIKQILVEDIPIENPIEGAELINEFKKPIKKRIKNMLADIEKIHYELGLYSSAEAALTIIVRLERIKLTTADSVISTLLEIIITKLHQFRKKAFHYMENVNEADKPLVFSTKKLSTLYEIFRNFPSTNVAIVFVERRLTAKVLYHIFSRLSKTNEKFSSVSADFIVGFNSSPFNDTREVLYMKKSNLATLRKFNNKETNVLFASNVIEEGIDIRLCNYVIKFDLPQTFRSYVQSKGRARNSRSTFILVMPEGDSQAANTYNVFKKMEEYMKNNLGGGRALNYLQDIDGDDDSLDDLPPYFANGPDSAKVTALYAITLINRYCLSLPQDQFCVLTTSWWVRPVEVDGLVKYEGILRLPINCPIKEDIRGPLCDSKIKAKRGVALETCKRLHQIGELNDSLLPCGRDSEILNDTKLFPHWDASETRAGSKKKRRVYNKYYSTWERNCRPQPNMKLYIHFIKVTTNYEKPENSRLAAFYDVLNSKRNFAIITSIKWPRICSFSMFMNVGEVNIEILDNIKTVKLNKVQINSLFTFHCLLFTEVLPNMKKFLMRDYENDENSFFIIPTIEDENKEINIDWETIRNHQEIPEIKPLDAEVRKNIVVNDETYLGKVVVPWYRCEGFKLRYIVSKVSTDENPGSPFPSANYESYAHYFEDRYSQKLLNPAQPLIEVRAISSKINCILPRGKRHRSSRKNRQNEDDFEETLIPELCFLYEFPAVYFLKATLLPSVLHRLHYLLIAEELRRSIAKKANLGVVNIPSECCEEPLRVDHTTLHYEDETKAHSTIEVSDLLTSNMNALKERIYPWKEEDEPYDIERLLTDVDMLAIKHYEKFMSESVGMKTIKHSARYGYGEESLIIEPLPTASLLLLSKRLKNNIGPQQSAILQALTSSSANDIINYERLETLGDSFLKYIVSLTLFVNYFDKDEGKLTQVKGKLIGNKNFFFIGRNINLGSILKVHDFSPGDWDIPCFGLSRDLQNLVKELKISPAVMYQINLSPVERDTGILKEETRLQIHELLATSQDTNESSHTSWSIIGQQEVPDKTIADAVEALVGVYLKSCGIEGAVKLCNWLGILAPELADIKNLLLTPPPTARLNPTGRVELFLIEPDRIERKLHYKFNDRSFLLQALTHSSYQNNVTDCYQRFEFLGDAILDFLITVHIYENCGNLSPGELTDLRSALVNNITFACLTVRYGFHKHINAKASKLNDIIERFVKHQESRDHKTGAEILFLIEEQSTQVAESVDVPKILGDVFESLAAAIYLDSGKNLQKVWDVYYHLMKREIDEFSRNVPKNHIRLLYEKFPNPLPKFGPSDLTKDGRVVVPLEVIHRQKQSVFHGLGDNKNNAKLAAAKLALRRLHEKDEDTVA
ncbi:hypothetical protein O3M35_000188 [Rhynocoris fuscipes]|uniref:Dicer-2 n=1 Tax=Rhynocoris fuscipes TaxID=488301 RepID=A0AAW1DPA8_9HEMI